MKSIVIQARNAGEFQNMINGWLENGHDWKKSTFQLALGGEERDDKYCMVFFYEEKKAQ